MSLAVVCLMTGNQPKKPEENSSDSFYIIKCF